MGVVISLMSRKGGVGKTSFCINLAGHWSETGVPVRLVDLDNQASLSQFFLGSEAVERLRPNESIEACLTGESKPEDVERETKFPNISLIPASFNLRATSDSELHLRASGATVTLLDLPPDLKNPVVEAAMLTSDFVLSPVDPEGFGAQSIVSVQNAMHSVALGFNRNLHLLGFVINRRQRLSVHNAIEEALRRIHQSAVMETVVPLLTAFKEATTFAQKPITMYQPKSQAAKVIRDLSDEMLERISQVSQGRAAA